MIAAARCVVARDLLLALRRRSDVATALLFFVIVASLFPLGVGPEPNQLRAMAAGVVWIAALLAALLSLPRLFAADHVDGTLEQMLVAPQRVPLEFDTCFEFMELGELTRQVKFAADV